MRKCVLLAASVLAVLAGLAGLACAQQPNDVSDGRFESEMPWMEVQAALPEFPRQEDLIALKGNFGAREYWVDSSSLKVDADGVVRFTMIINADDVKNTIYEGVRCETKEHKVYSVGRNNGTWGRVQASKWQRITNRGFLGYHDMLYKDFFCPGNQIVASKDEALDALKRGMHPRAEPRR
jgi:hypothetical protein